MKLNNHCERCIYQFVYNLFNSKITEYYHYNHHEQQFKLSFSIGSKLYCSIQNNHNNKLIDHYDFREICFYPNDKIHVEHRFTDIFDLSDLHKNKETQEFIENNRKLAIELTDDCYNQKTILKATEF